MMAELLYQAVPEVEDPCWLCGRDTRGCYVVWGLRSGEAVHVCDLCLDSAPDREDDPADGEEGF
jgi:hypothetical protein